MEKLCKVRKHIQSLQAGCEPRGGRADTRRALDFSPLPCILCINVSNVNNFQMLGFQREDPGLQKLPSNRISALHFPPTPSHEAAPTAGGSAAAQDPCPARCTWMEGIPKQNPSWPAGSREGRCPSPSDSPGSRESEQPLCNRGAGASR